MDKMRFSIPLAPVTKKNHQRIVRNGDCICEGGEFMEIMLGFAIPLNPVTKKNHQRIIKTGGRPCVIPSKQYAAYEKAAAAYIPFTAAPIDAPVEVSCRFYMQTRRRVDLTNLLEAVDDVLVKCGVLADDNSRIIVSHDGSRVLYDKYSPRTEITIRRIGTGEGDANNGQ